MRAIQKPNEECQLVVADFFRGQQNFLPHRPCPVCLVDGIMRLGGKHPQTQNYVAVQTEKNVCEPLDVSDKTNVRQAFGFSRINEYSSNAFDGIHYLGGEDAEGA